MPQDLYQYEKMVERALRGVVREALERAAGEGLAGRIISISALRPTCRGSRSPKALRARYPQEMTIVLQHQYWDLEVGEDGSRSR